MSERYRGAQGSGTTACGGACTGAIVRSRRSPRGPSPRSAPRLNADLEAASPCREIRHEPSEADAREASQLFGELEDDLNVAEFEAWLEGLHHERFRQVSQAIDVLRGRWPSSAETSACVMWRVGSIDRRAGPGSAPGRQPHARRPRRAEEGPHHDAHAHRARLAGRDRRRRPLVRRPRPGPRRPRPPRPDPTRTRRRKDRGSPGPGRRGRPRSAGPRPPAEPDDQADPEGPA